MSTRLSLEQTNFCNLREWSFQCRGGKLCWFWSSLNIFWCSYASIKKVCTARRDQTSPCPTTEANITTTDILRPSWTNLYRRIITMSTLIASSLRTTLRSSPAFRSTISAIASSSRTRSYATPPTDAGERAIYEKLATKFPGNRLEVEDVSGQSQWIARKGQLSLSMMDGKWTESRQGSLTDFAR